MKSNSNERHLRLVKLVQIALITAIVVVLQLIGAVIHFGPFSVSLVLVPIVIGAILYGPLAGAWLGFV
ncbi:MAG: ECF transporter S component, partial [Clostridia bacterium]|nr:ECF transporter S component [Clostridia bacterium]